MRAVDHDRTLPLDEPPRPSTPMRVRRSFTWTPDGRLLNWLRQPARGRLVGLLMDRSTSWLERGWRLRLAEFRTATNGDQRYFLYGTPAEHPDLDPECIDEFVIYGIPRRRASVDAKKAPLPPVRREVMPLN